MKAKQIRATLLLLLGTFIWGSAFLAQKAGGESVGTFTFNALRSVIATLALASATALQTFFQKKKDPAAAVPALLSVPGVKKKHLIAGIACGTALTLASVFQQLGISYPGVTTAKSGFLTALYVVIVPFVGLFLGRKLRWNLGFGCLLGLGGMFLLCLGDTGSFCLGDLYLILCALMYSVHILLLDRFSPGCHSLLLSCIQFATVSILCFLPMVLWEKPSFSQIAAAVLPILYAGLLSSGVAYTLQVYCQKILHPALASLIMCFESVFALLCGWAFGETPGLFELIGCGVVFLGVLLSQFDPELLAKRKSKQPLSTK